MRYIVSASVSLEIGEEFEGPPWTITFSPPKDHPALMELWKWYSDQLLVEAKKESNDPTIFL